MYRILTEDKNRPQILELCVSSFDGFTAIPAIGYWNGKPESSLIIEIETTDGAGVRVLGECIREMNSQESVMVQEVPSQVEFLNHWDTCKNLSLA